MRLFEVLNKLKRSMRRKNSQKFLCLFVACLATVSARAQIRAAAIAAPGAGTTAPASTPGSTVVSPSPAPIASPVATPTTGDSTGNPAMATTSNNPSTNSINNEPLDGVPTRLIKTLTLDECIRLALQHNLDIQIQQYYPLVDRYGISVNYGAYEPTFNFTATKSYNDRPSAPGNSINPATGLPFPSSIGESDTYVPEIRGVLPTGLTYDMTGPISRNSSLSVGQPPYYLPPLWNSDPGITLSQPLLKNFWIDSTRLQIQLSKAKMKIDEATLRLQVMTTVTAVKNAYFNLLYYRGNVEANLTAYQLAEELVKQNVTRVQVGALAQLDEKQSESQAATSLAAMQASQQAQSVEEHTLINLLTDNYSEWTGVSLVPAEQLTAVPQHLDLQESWRLAVTQRPDLVAAKLRVEQQNVTLKYDFNQIFPSLNVQGSYGRNAIENTFNDNLGTIQNGNHSFYSYGATVSIPLGGNIAARNTYKSDKVSLKQLLLTLKQTEQNIVVAVDNDVGSVRSTLQQVYATRDARVYAESALDAERQKLQNGKSTSFIVLQLISNLTTAKVNELQALVSYNNAVAQLSLDEGDTLNANGIDLKIK